MYSLVFLNKVIDGPSKLMVDRESKSDIEAHTHQSWADSLVESHVPILGKNAFCAVSNTSVFMSIESLHFCFDDVNRVVSHARAESSKHSSDHISAGFEVDIAAQPVCSVSVDDKSHSLVGGLLDQSGTGTFVHTCGTSLLTDGVHTVEDITVLRSF